MKNIGETYVIGGDLSRMKVRSITIGVTPASPLRAKDILEAGQFALSVQDACERAGIGVQTRRLATPPFLSYLCDFTDQQILQFAREIEECSQEHGFDYCSLGPVGEEIRESSRFLTLVPQIISETSRVFTSAFLVQYLTQSGVISPSGIARVIQTIAKTTEKGFGNLRFAALMHCSPHTPFFPAAYHEGANSFAFALEAADLIHTVCCSVQKLETLEDALREEMQRQVLPLQRIGEELEARGFVFRGIDLSPAPGPSAEASIAYALEGVGLGRFGEPGTLTTAGIVTSALKKTRLRTCGYCGLMLPVLEDIGLAERNSQGLLRLTNLLAYSAVCGTGLDTIPLSGDVTELQLAALLTDVATLSEKLSKPLSARLLPIPGKRTGDMTEFEFDYFVNTKVMEVL